MARKLLLLILPLLMVVSVTAHPHKRIRRVALVEMGSERLEELADSAPRVLRLIDDGRWASSMTPRQVNAQAEYAAQPSNPVEVEGMEPSSLEKIEVAAPSTSIQLEAAAPSDHVEEEAAPSNLEDFQEGEASNFVDTNEAAPSNVEEWVDESAPSNVEEWMDEAVPTNVVEWMDEAAPSNMEEWKDEAVPSNVVEWEDEAAPSKIIERENEVPSVLAEMEKIESTNVVEKEEAAPLMEASHSRVLEVEVSPSQLVEIEGAAPSRSVGVVSARHTSPRSTTLLRAARAEAIAAAAAASSPVRTASAEPSSVRMARLVDLGAMEAMAAGPLPLRSPKPEATSVHVRTRYVSQPDCSIIDCKRLTSFSAPK